MKAALVVMAAALVAWISQWSFAPPPSTARAPVRSVRVAPPPPRVDLALDVAPAPPPADVHAEPVAVTVRRWTDADRDQLARTLAGQSNDQKTETFAALVRDANAGKVQLDPPIL